MRPLTPDLLAAATGSSDHNATVYFEPIVAAMDQFQITETAAAASFLAHVAIESARLTTTEESLYYKDAARIARTYLRIFDADKDRKIEPEEIEAAKPYVCNHAKLAKLLYNGYHGRGLIQLTWKQNYQLATDALGFDYVGHPDWVKAPDHAALTAAWFFASHGCIDVADDIEATTRIINPALMHLAERTEQFEKNLELLA